MVRTLSQLRPVRTPTLKTQKKMHMKSISEELELVKKMTMRSKSHKEKNQTRTKRDDASMQWFELSTNDMIKLLTREPPLIVRQSILQLGLPTTTMRPVKYKTYQGQTFSLHEVHLS